MRLVKTSSRGELSLTLDLTEDIPRYAILSHTWGANEEEVTLNDLQYGTGKSKAGYKKIQFCAEQARKDGLKYIWVDTCCIDKANHTELSEAIASMFRWYRHAVKCYVFLSDVSARKRDNEESQETWDAAFRESRWFTRGWTLQELLAPKLVEFFSREGERLGDKNTLEQEIYEITEIPIAALRGVPLSDFSIDERMRWAEKRTTKRKEDKAYCLMGIFKVFIPLIYGEGENAFTRLKGELDRCFRRTLDLNKLPYAKGAMFNSYSGDHKTCHPATRVDLLLQVHDWAQQPQGKSIFWLKGMAGTGKSTISWTVAEWLTDQDHLGLVNLGASFFFKRGEGDRGSASRFFSTITRQLVLKIRGMDSLIADVITSDPLIFDKALGEQFDKLIYQPLRKLNAPSGHYPILVLVVDALDECEKECDIKAILDLWSRLPQITTIRLKLFLTSRPDLPIQLGFKFMSIDSYQDMVLQDAAPPTTIRHDIFVFLKDSFSEIRQNYNTDPPLGRPLDHDWPGEKVLEALVNMADPLFIVAATVHRFVGDPNWDPQEQLEAILKFQGAGHLEQMEQTYLPVLTQLTATLCDSRDKEKLYHEFRTIVGSIVTLAEPLSVTSLAAILSTPTTTIVRRILSLHSVLQVPPDSESPIRTLHLSFREFLLSDRLQQKPFGVDGPATHRMLSTRCLQLLSAENGLHENMCELRYPGQLRKDVDLAMIDRRLSPSLQYACRYWVHHVQHSMIQIRDEDKVHKFLQKHFLHWLEALSLMNRIAEAISFVRVLQSVLSVDNSIRLSSFLEDARRVILGNRNIVDIAPLQIYSSAMIFAPQSSIVRTICARLPGWILRYPVTLAGWGFELLKLEGHTKGVRTLVFSPDGSLLASTSADWTIRLWNSTTGQEVLKLEGHVRSEVAFSYDSSLLIDRTVSNPATSGYTTRVWSATTGQEVPEYAGHTDWVKGPNSSPDGSLLAFPYNQAIELQDTTTGQTVLNLWGHAGSVTAVAFSHDGLLLASASEDQTIRLWSLTEGQALRMLRGHTHSVLAVAFSPDGLLLASASGDQIIRLWDIATGREMLKLEGHTESVTAVSFSPDGSVLASASDDRTIRLWSLAAAQEAQNPAQRLDRESLVSVFQRPSPLAPSSSDQAVELWHLTDGQILRKPKAEICPVRAVTFSPDGSLLASVSKNETVRLWNPVNGQIILQLEGHSDWVKAVAFSPNCSLLASASNDRTVILWNSTTGRRVLNLRGHTDWVTAVVFSYDGSLLASASEDQTIRLWDPSTGEEVLKLRGHTHSMTALAFSHDDSLLASASDDRTVRIWNPRTGEEVLKLEGHTDSVTAVAFSHDGSGIASASNDGTVRLWNPTTGEKMQTFEEQAGITAIRFSFDNTALLTNRGTISVGDETTLCSALKSSTRTTTRIRDGWILQGDYNVLWLPQEYRSGCSAFHGGTIAIGLNSGHVRFIQLDDVEVLHC